jgi:hypothetical protein
MELISLQGKTNFFEKRVSEYQKANVMRSASGESISSATATGNGAGASFSLEADF